jgi:hypothetical protein
VRPGNGSIRDRQPLHDTTSSPVVCGAVIILSYHIVVQVDMQQAEVLDGCSVCSAGMQHKGLAATAVRCWCCCYCC